jgi:hypothetical protein
MDRDGGCHGIQPGEIFPSQLDRSCVKVLNEPVLLASAGDGDDPWLLGQQPGEGDLRRCSTLAGKPGGAYRRRAGILANRYLKMAARGGPARVLARTTSTRLPRDA